MSPSQTTEPARCFVIGDIHGHLAALDALLSKLTRVGGMNDGDALVFLGDYVDRGPDEKGVLERVRNLQLHRPNTIALLGNHDAWRISPNSQDPWSDWFRSLPTHVMWKNFFLSHAPVYRFPQDERFHSNRDVQIHGLQSFAEAVSLGYNFVDSYQGFEREDLLRDPQYIGVCGHVHHPRVRIFPNHYIGLDTGCGLGGSLSAIRLPDLKIWTVPETG